MTFANIVILVLAVCPTCRAVIRAWRSFLNVHRPRHRCHGRKSAQKETAMN